MKSAPHLLSEDRAEFVRLLDEALRAAHDGSEPALTGGHLGVEQLRTMALDAAALIASAAAEEYERFTRLRAEARRPSPPRIHESAESDDAPEIKEMEKAGAGVAAVIAVLVPVLAGIAAVIFLLLGYLFEVVGSAHTFADSLVAIGWFFASVMALGIVAGGIALVLAALRNRASQVMAADDAVRDNQLALAREAWQNALVERGILPFLRHATATASGAPEGSGPASSTRPATLGPTSTGSTGHLPKIGYSGPHFSSPDGGDTESRRPSYSSPDFSSPDYGGPEHQPE